MEQNASQQNVVAFDMADLGTAQNAETPVWMEIQNNRDGSGTGILFELRGKDSEAYRKLNRKQLNKRFEKMAITKKIKMTAEENESETMKLLVACVSNFKQRLYERKDGVLVPVSPEQFKSTLSLKGEELSFSPENVARVFLTIPEIKEQVEDFLGDRTNFLPESQTQ